MNKGGPALVTPAYTGVTLLLSWIYLTFYAATAGIEASAPISLMSVGYMTSALFMTATVLVITFSSFDGSTSLTSPSVKVATPLILASSTLLLIAGGTLHSLVFGVIGGVLTGLSSGIMSQQWIIAYRRVSLKMAICSFPVLMAMSVCVCMTIMYLPRAFLYAAIVILPIASELMFHWVSFELLPIVEVESGPKDRPLNFLLVVLPIVLCYLASGFLDYFSGISYYTFVFYAFCAFIPFVLAAAFAFVVDRKHITQTVLVPVAFLVVMGVPILSMHAYLPVAQFISIGELGLEVVIFVAAVAFSDFFNLNSLKVYALARTCATLFNSIGWYIAAFVERSCSGIASVQLSLLVVFLGIEILVVCLIVSIVKAQKSIVEDIGEEKLDCVASAASISIPSDAFPKAEDSRVFVGSDSGDAGISAGKGGDSSSEGNAAPPRGGWNRSSSAAAEKLQRNTSSLIARSTSSSYWPVDILLRVSRRSSTSLLVRSTIIRAIFTPSSAFIPSRRLSISSRAGLDRNMKCRALNSPCQHPRFLAAHCGTVGSEQNLGVAASFCGFEFDRCLLEKHHMQLKTAS